MLLKMKGTDGAVLWSGVLQGLPNPHSPSLQVFKDACCSRHPSVLSLTLVGSSLFTATYWKREIHSCSGSHRLVPGVGTTWAQHGNCTAQH